MDHDQWMAMQGLTEPCSGGRQTKLVLHREIGPGHSTIHRFNNTSALSDPIQHGIQGNEVGNILRGVKSCPYLPCPPLIGRPQDGGEFAVIHAHTRAAVERPIAGYGKRSRHRYKVILGREFRTQDSKDDQHKARAKARHMIHPETYVKFTNMSTRTFEELQDAVRAAMSVNDESALSLCAVELDALGTTEARALAENVRGVADLWSGNYTAALEHYQRAIVLYEELDDRGGVARSNVNIGTVYLSTGNYTAAFENYQRALEVHQELGNLDSVANVSMGIGTVHSKTGNFQAALESHHRGLAQYKESGNRHGEANIYTCIGNVLSDTGNYPSALDYHHRSLAIHEEQGNRIGVALATSGIGLVHNRIGNYAAALEHYHRVLALYEELGNSPGLAFITSNIGNVHGNAGNLPAALVHHRRALALFEELGDQSGVAGALANITSTLEKSGLYSDAEEQLQKLDAMQIVVPGMITTIEQTRAALQEHNGN
ncbi:MAG: tetratricopeptide repeat protein, partial [Ignavibacteriae bacterium]